MALSKAILLLSAAAGVVLFHHYYGLMPDPMASHFDGAGRPNGFQSRDGFFFLASAMLLLVIVVFAGTGMLFRLIPTKWFNLPNREYWLSPERRESTVDFMTRQMEWFGVATMVVLIAAVKLACDANLTRDSSFDSSSMWWLLGLYFLYTGGWLAYFVRGFRRVS